MDLEKQEYCCQILEVLNESPIFVIMKKKQSPIIQASELMTIRQAENFVLIDTRSAKDNYLKNHLEGALHVDLNAELSDIKADLAIGGRHPLPTTAQFSALLTKLGIAKDSQIVLYDDKNGAIASARFWWMLTAVGHEKVQVLNGGLKAAEEIGFPTSSEIEKAKNVEPYLITGWNLPMATMEEIEKVAADKAHIIIDVRANERYNGATEPIDLIAGHIPGAINVSFSGNLEDNGCFLSPSQLKDKYQAVFGETPIENITVHCGSGVTACHTLLALAYADFDIPKLYVGSWSEWSRNDKPIGTNL